MDEHEKKEAGADSTSAQQHESNLGDVPASDPRSAESGSGETASGLEREELQEVSPTGIKLQPEELPTLQWSDIDAELADFELGEEDENWSIDSVPPSSLQVDQPSGFEDAMTWLEQLAAGGGMPIDEMPTLVTAPPSEGSKPIRNDDQQSASSSVLSARPVSELDSDPMAWLEQLAVDQSSPLEELPSVADRLLASEIVSQTEIPPGNTIHDPIEIGRALGFLEQLAMDQGVDLSAVSYEPRLTDGLDNALVLVDGLALARLEAAKSEAHSESEDAATKDSVEQQVMIARKGVTSGGREHLVEGMPEDPQEALAWLGGFADDDRAPDPAVVEEVDTVGPHTDKVDPQDSETRSPEPDRTVPVQDMKGSDADAAVLQEMPNDPDEAMAWMQNLARQVPGGPDLEEPLERVADEEPLSSSSFVASSGTLSDAELALEQGNIGEALSLFQSFVARDEASEELIAALEKAAGEYPDNLQFLRLMGDALMQVGEVDRAVAAYRRGFDQL